MPSDVLDRSISSLSINSTDSQPEDDWDHSLNLDNSVVTPIEVPVADSSIPATVSQLSYTAPRNFIVFPVDGTAGRATHFNSHNRSESAEGLDVGMKKRTLSDLLNLHSERGSNRDFSIEEAKRIADVLGQWINSSSSPYEAEDDFFMRNAQDDISLNTSGSFKKASGTTATRPRGKSETVWAA